MIRKSPTLTRWLVTALMAASTFACVSHKQTGYLDIGNRLDFRQLVSQHGAPYAGTEKLQLVVYADSMAANRMSHQVLGSFDAGCFNEGVVAFVGDVSGMPSFITRIAAVPLMQSYPYPVWLDYDGTATQNLPVQKDQVSLIEVEDGRLESIGYAHTEAGVIKALEQYCKRDTVAAGNASTP